MKSSLCLSLLFFIQCISGQRLAFPGAEGFGAYTMGGSGGKVIYVTNLNDSGLGSLRQAIEEVGPRTILFKVSGIIKLKNKLVIKNPYITIAGQTAPGDGICIKGASFIIAADEVIVRYLRVRLGDIGYDSDAIQGKDAISINQGKNIIIDHCSASWSLDEVLSVSSGKPNINNVTVQWSFITEALNSNNHGFGSLIRGTQNAQYSFLYNLYAHNQGRNPRPGNYDTNSFEIDPKGLLLDFRNNLIYNWGGSYAGYNADELSVTRMNYVGNYLIPGIDSKNNNIAYKTGSAFNSSYFNENYYNHQLQKDDWSVVKFNANWSQKDIENFKKNEPFENGHIIKKNPNDVFQNILKTGGAYLPKRDAVDERIITNIKKGTGKIIKSQNEVGGWPIYKSKKALKDTDSDGIPNSWEKRNGLNPNCPDDGNNRNKEGYTMLEIYLNQII